MKFSKLLLIALSISLFASCSSDDNDGPKGAYDNGFFIVNEGSSAPGTVSFSSNDFSIFTKDAYGAENGSDVLGKFIQNIFFDGDKAYIIAGGSNVINIVNRYTFKLITKIDSGLVNPRYGVIKDGKAYVTNANSYDSVTDDYIAVINLATNVVESKISLNTTANRIVEEGGKLYITDPMGTDKLSIYNLNTKTLETPITIGSGSDSIEEENGTLFILRPSFTQSSEIIKVKISDKSVSKITIPESQGVAGFLDIENNQVYYTVGSSVYSITTSATTAATTPLFTANPEIGYLYGFAVKNNRAFFADGKFTQDSKAYIYNLTGTLQKELTTGIGTNGFYFND